MTVQEENVLDLNMVLLVFQALLLLIFSLKFKQLNKNNKHALTTFWLKL